MYCYIAANDKTLTTVYQYLMLNAKNLGGDGQKCKVMAGGQRISAVRVDADGSLYSAPQFTAGQRPSLFRPVDADQVLYSLACSLDAESGVMKIRQ